MAKHELSGIYPATPTPHGADGKLNGPVLQRLVEAQLRAGVDGFYVSGATGEGILHSVEERVETVRLIMDQVGGRCKVIAHVGAQTTDDAVHLAGQVAALGVDALSALPPLFYKVPFAAVVDFYRQIATAGGKPLLAYYIPALSGTAFTVDQFDELLAIKHVVGVKFSDYNFFVMEQILARHKDAVVMSGNDEVMVGSLSIGAAGAIGLTLNLMPALYAQLYRVHAASDIDSARQLQNKANRLIAMILGHGAGGIVVLKPILKMLGFDCGAPRGPLPALDEAAECELREQLDGIGFFEDPIYSAWATDQP